MENKYSTLLYQVKLIIIMIRDDDEANSPPKINIHANDLQFPIANMRNEDTLA